MDVVGEQRAGSVAALRHGSIAVASLSWAASSGSLADVFREFRRSRHRNCSWSGSDTQISRGVGDPGAPRSDNGDSNLRCPGLVVRKSAQKGGLRLAAATDASLVVPSKGFLHRRVDRA